MEHSPPHCQSPSRARVRHLKSVLSANPEEGLWCAGRERSPSSHAALPICWGETNALQELGGFQSRGNVQGALRVRQRQVLGARVWMPKPHQIGAPVAQRPKHSLGLSLGSLESASGLQLRVWLARLGCCFPAAPPTACLGEG